MNNDGEIEKLLEDIFNEEDVDISNSELELEWRKFKKLKQDKHKKEKKSENLKKLLYAAIGIAIVFNFISKVEYLERQHVSHEIDNKSAKENIYK